MLIVTDINGNTEPLSGYKGLKRFRSVSGEKSLTFSLSPNELNKHSFDMAQEESILEFDGEEYRIKKLSEKSRGIKYVKEVYARHTFFDLVDQHIYNIHTGSLTFANAVQFVLGGTDYTWSIVDNFLAEDWENFGDDNRLALLQEILKRYGAEFELNGKYIKFIKKKGNSTDVQFRYNYNIKTINRNVNSSNLSTYIKGFGKGIESEYTSPNAALFGIREAKPVRDERYSTLEGLNKRLKTEIKDTPEVSITIDFVDLRRAGYPFDVPNEGDDVFLIYEPMNIDLEARIIDIEEEFIEGHSIPLKTNVTLSNFRNSIVKKFVGFSQTQKTLNGIVDGSGKVKYNVLDEAVKRATESLQSAQSELEFENGIIARSKDDPNHLVLLNSAGIGISRDGGNTFKEAITSSGFVLSAGAIGQLAANNVQIGAETKFESGYNPSAVNQKLRDDLRLTAPLPTSLTMNQDGITASTINSDRYARLDYRGLYVNKGAIHVKRPDGFSTIIDGMVNQDFNIQGATPPFMLGAEILGRYFKTNQTSSSPAICQVFTFKKTARYLKFQLGIGVDKTGNQARAFIEQTGVPGVWLGSATGSALVTDGGEEKWISVDLGVPDGNDFAVYLRLYTNSTDTGAYVRVVRAFLTDF